MIKRIKYVDIARALCVIWIVCFWHMNQYLIDECKIFPSDSYIREVALNITDGVLALFTLISGYFMSKKEVYDKKGILEFYKKRLLRFEIPLILSCVCLVAMGGIYLYIRRLRLALGWLVFCHYLFLRLFGTSQ